MFGLSLLLLVVSYVVGVTGSCGGTIYVESRTPFYSPNYPRAYFAFHDCRWTVTGSRKIRLHFEMFQVEGCTACQCDYLEIRDGNTSASNLVGKYCGAALPPPFVSSNNQLLIIFKSDRGAEAAGFRAYFEPVGESCNQSGSVFCQKDNTCISKQSVCDGKKDCSSGADERQCTPCRTGNLTLPYGKIGNHCDEDLEIEHLMTIDISCKPGYALETESHKSMQCINGEWPAVPRCVPACTSTTFSSTNVELVDPNNATYLPEEQAILKCHNGYFVSDDLLSQFLMITCKGNNQWVPDTFTCLPQKHFRYIYQPQPVEIIDAQEGQTLILFCDQKLQLSPEFKARLSFQWLKNALDIRTIPNVMFRITSEGNLVLLNVTDQYTGIYSCLLKEHLNYVAESNITYVVKIKTLCRPLPNNSALIARQNTSIAMFCPNTVSLFQEPPIWFNTKGKRIFNNQKYTLISNYGLLLKSIEYYDQGSYTCDLGPNTQFCERHFTTNLQVIPSKEDFCGITRNDAGFPWLVTMWWNDETAPFCYGALVHERWVLTTAFCLIGLHRKRDPDVYVKLGRQNLIETVGNSTTIAVEFAKIHPQYSRRISLADIGIIKLKQPVTYTNDITPICLSGFDLKPVPDNSSCDTVPPIIGNVSGLGSLEGDLKFAGVECMKMASEESCPSTPTGSSCAKGCDYYPDYVADVGSPLQVMHNGKMYLYGIFSWGERRAKLTDFDYFTLVHPYYKWIASYINRND